jgi:hypothetical protein
MQISDAFWIFAEFLKRDLEKGYKALDRTTFEKSVQQPPERSSMRSHRE